MRKHQIVTKEARHLQAMELIYHNNQWQFIWSIESVVMFPKEGGAPACSMEMWDGSQLYKSLDAQIEVMVFD